MNSSNPVQLPQWHGQTVAVIGAAPTLTPALADSVQHLPCIAINRAVLLAPWAQVLMSIDGNWPTGIEAFEGLRVVGVLGIEGGAYLPIPYEVVDLGPAHQVHIRSNALAAIRLAAQCGASKIVLLGFDTERYEQIHAFRGLTQGLAALIAELAAQGASVEFIASEAA
jgi:hypothetical protein